MERTATSRRRAGRVDDATSGLAEPAAAVETLGLRVDYGGTTALDDVSLRVPTGAMAALVGPNGAGKSTLLKAVLGLLDPDGGEVRLLGETARDTRARVSLGRVGYVPQRSTVNWDFPADALDVVMMGLYHRLGLFRRPGRRERERAMAALEQVDMAGLAQRAIGNLSGGQQQRVFLARALVQDPDLYLLDEPLAGVDAASEAAIVAVLKRLNREGKTIVAVHHDLNTLTDYFDWVALLNVRLMGQGAMHEVLDSDAFDMAYGGAAWRRGNARREREHAELPS